MKNSEPRWLLWLTQSPFAKESEFRLLVADLLCKRRDVCNTKAIMWALYGDFWDAWDLLPYSKWYGFHTVTTCRRETRRVGVCYCRKFASQSFAEDADLRYAIIVTPTIEPEDAIHGATVTFKGEE